MTDPAATPLRRRAVPAPGQAPLPAPNAAALLRRNASDPATRDRPAVWFEDRVWTHAEYVAESRRWANLLLDRLPEGRPRHVAVLLDNRPEYLFAFGGAAFAGAAVVGLNHTRRGEHLLRDARHTDCGLVVTEPKHLELLEPVLDQLPPVLVVGEGLEDALAAYDDGDPGLEPSVDTPWGLIFTSGTSDAPKAVICSQRRLMVTGNRMGIIMDLGPDDIGYVCMPLFHSNAVQVGWAPSLVYGCSVGLARRFSASRWLADVRHYGATYFNYTGKPLAYLLAQPERPDDADNPLRVAFGNEGSPEVVDAFSRRFGVDVIDAYGATEGGVAVNRDVEERAGALGRAGEGVKVVDDDGNEKPRARFDEHGRLTNAEACVGEIVNTGGAGPFEGYYNNPEATARTTRFGWYWSGDLGYLDDDGYLYFAGRNADWIRVDGENFPAGPIEEALRHHPDVVLATVYGVPDDQAGDQVMAGLVLRDGASFDPAGFAAWVDGLPDVGPKWRPRYVRLLGDPPTTGTNKIVKRTLVHQKWRRDRVGGDPVFVRLRGETAYRPFAPDDEDALAASFVHYRREQFWDL
ncbi:MAG: AMP-binding protein [Actinobacteria bacterium]|nr:AMP-binding protein [Actinomycetota bacterium]